jgi:hypothetical protein
MTVNSLFSLILVSMTKFIKMMFHRRVAQIKLKLSVISVNRPAPLNSEGQRSVFNWGDLPAPVAQLCAGRTKDVHEIRAKYGLQ